MEVACLFSGAKDSTFSAYYAKQRYKLKYLITAYPKEGSYMFHHPNIKLTKVQAKLIGVKQIFYNSCSIKEEEVEELKKVISNLEVDALVAGTLASQYQKSRISKIAKDLNLELITPLWKIDQEKYLKSLVSLGFKIIISSVSAEGFTEDWLGRELDEDCIRDLKELNKKFEISVAGEGGEYETFVTDCPIFSKRIEIVDSKKIFNKAEYSGRLEIKKIRLINKSI